MNSRSSAFFEDQAFLDTAGLSVPVLNPDYTALDKFLTGAVPLLPRLNRASFCTGLEHSYAPLIKKSHSSAKTGETLYGLV